MKARLEADKEGINKAIKRSQEECHAKCRAADHFKKALQIVEEGLWMLTAALL
jgi:hypothetical protein